MASETTHLEFRQAHRFGGVHGNDAIGRRLLELVGGQPPSN